LPARVDDDDARTGRGRCRGLGRTRGAQPIATSQSSSLPACAADACLDRVSLDAEGWPAVAPAVALRTLERAFRR
jgi:hypothetical protein